MIAVVTAAIPVEFVLFGLTLLGVAVLHKHSLGVALTGLVVITIYKLVSGGFDGGVAGLAAHFAHEWVVLANLFLLLLGFALLARHFEHTAIADVLPRLLPDDWKGGLALLAIIFVMSGFLDNIAAAIIGGTIAATVYGGRVHIGFIAAIVAASNAGGAGSVIGDTTTTMMWITGVSPLEVFHAYIASAVAFVVFAIPASIAQQRFAPIVANSRTDVRIDWASAGVVAFILAAAIVVNVLVNVRAPDLADRFPFLGAAVWGATLFATPVRRPDWSVLPHATGGAIFLLSLVACASMMPVESLPAPSWQTALGLGFLSSVFDNIPLTKLALDQDGYDWGFLAYAVGFGGSMIWFGSSAGVAIATRFDEARSVFAWVRHGWYIAIGYVVGYFALLALLGWHARRIH
jgi:Na+/H+ antiporter NhaD/arsenite permease-like protein